MTKETRSRVINKICDPILKLEPTEIPALAYQLISLCKSAALVLIPLYAFNQYFHRHCYKKIYADMDSDQSNYDSIGMTQESVKVASEISCNVTVSICRTIFRQGTI